MDYLGKIRGYPNQKDKVHVIDLPEAVMKYDIHFENEAVQYFKVHFDFSYYLLLTPFRFKWSKAQGKYKIVTNKYQQIVRVITCLVTSIYYLLKVRDMYTSASQGAKSPAMFFELAYYFFDTFFLLTMFGIFGTKKNTQAMEKIFLDLQKSNQTYSKNPYAYIKTKKRTTIILWACLSTLIMHFLEILQGHSWNFMDFLMYYQQDGEKMLSIFGSFTEGGRLGICCIFSIIPNYLEKVLNSFSDILFTMVVLVFSTMVKDFRHHLNTTKSTQEALNHYYWLREMTSQINDAFSYVVGAFVIGNLPFYATNVLDIFKDTSNIFMTMRYTFYCCYFFPSLFLAGKANRSTEEIRGWLYKKENYSQLDSRALSVTLQETHGSIGISSFHLFVITYSFVGSVISIIVTYALLKTQFAAEAEGAAMNVTDITTISPMGSYPAE